VYGERLTIKIKELEKLKRARLLSLKENLGMMSYYIVTVVLVVNIHLAQRGSCMKK
jgi:hypothetical protein